MEKIVKTHVFEIEILKLQEENFAKRIEFDAMNDRFESYTPVHITNSLKDDLEDKIDKN